MKQIVKNLLLSSCILCLLFSCNNEEEDPILYKSYGEEAYLLKYKFNDINGFKWDEKLVELLEKDTAYFEYGWKIVNTNGLIYPINGDKNVSTSFQNYIYDFYNQLVTEGFNTSFEETIYGTMGTFLKVNENQTLIGGIKYNKIWLGLFDENTKELLKEWIDTEEIETKVSLSLGYGEYEDFEITKLSINNNIFITDNGYCILTYPYTYRAIFIDGDKLKSIFLDSPTKDISNVKKWFNSSIIVGPFPNMNIYPAKYYVFSNSGEIITKFYSSSITDIDIPCSYHEKIKILSYGNKIKIQRFNLETEEEIWATYIDRFNFSENNIKISFDVISIEENIWEIKCEAAELTGELIKTHFYIDIESGEIEYIE